jgi:hypothetical protein
MGGKGGMRQQIGMLGEFAVELNDGRQGTRVSGIQSIVFPSRITSHPSISVQGADAQRRMRSFGRGMVFAREFVRGIVYLATFSLMGMGSWAQQPGSHIPGAAPSPDRNGQLMQLEEMANETNERDDVTGLAMRRPTVTCILQPYPGLSNTVSARSLELPQKMQDEYQRACMALKSQKRTEAEKHLRKALQYSPDALGWVMLGRLFEIMARWDEAAKACGEAVIQDPYYWAADVCLAEIDAYQHKWKESLEASNRAVSLSQESKRFAYYVSAFALLNLQQVSDAESRALEAAKLDGDHQLPGLGLLLVRIQQFKGYITDLEVDRINETVALNGSEQTQTEGPVLLADRR